MKKQFKETAVVIGLALAIVLLAGVCVMMFMSNSTSKASGTKTTKEELTNDDSDDQDSEESKTTADLEGFTVAASEPSKDTTEKDKDDKDNEESEDEGDGESEEESDDDYVISDSDSRKLTEDDLKDLSAEQLSHARNEIYARHGRIFKDDKLKSYFESKSWYEGKYTADEFPDDELSETEKDNAKLIKKYEEKQKDK